MELIVLARFGYVDVTKPQFGKEKKMKICVRFYGEFYTHTFEGYKTLKDVMQDYGLSRKSIKEWWKE